MFNIIRIIRWNKKLSLFFLFNKYLIKTLIINPIIKDKNDVKETNNELKLVWTKEDTIFTMLPVCINAKKECLYNEYTSKNPPFIDNNK